MFNGIVTASPFIGDAPKKLLFSSYTNIKPDSTISPALLVTLTLIDALPSTLFFSIMFVVVFTLVMVKIAVVFFKLVSCSYSAVNV